MYDGGYRPNAGFYKSMRVVGDVMSHYHPHGDAAVYDALARLVQWWSMRYPLVTGQVTSISENSVPQLRVTGVQDGPAGYGNGPRHRREHS